jgi:anthranilate synthase/aminodeoxychorismate synthase-like glutamine amidotransferase
MKALLIDHDDSFTYNLQHWLSPICEEIEVLNHRDLKSNSHANFIVLSPGPKSPQDYPHVLEFLKRLPERTAVFGVCLGLQMLVEINGGKIKAYSPPLHGKKSKLDILSPHYKSLHNTEVARYHSLYCSEYSQTVFETLAKTADDQIPMWLKHKNKKHMGVQFHPESFLTSHQDVHLKFLSDWLQS